MTFSLSSAARPQGIGRGPHNPLKGNYYRYFIFDNFQLTLAEKHQKWQIASHTPLTKLP